MSSFERNSQDLQTGLVARLTVCGIWVFPQILAYCLGIIRLITVLNGDTRRFTNEKQQAGKDVIVIHRRKIN